MSRPMTKMLAPTRCPRQRVRPMGSTFLPEPASDWAPSRRSSDYLPEHVADQTATRRGLLVHRATLSICPLRLLGTGVSPNRSERVPIRSTDKPRADTRAWFSRELK